MTNDRDDYVKLECHQTTITLFLLDNVSKDSQTPRQEGLWLLEAWRGDSGQATFRESPGESAEGCTAMRRYLKTTELCA